MDGGARWQPRFVGLALCIAAIATLSIALSTRSWWTHRIHHDTSIDVGLWSTRVCVGPYSTRYLDKAHAPVIENGRWACAVQRVGQLADRLEADRDAFIVDDVWDTTSRPLDDGHRWYSLLGTLGLALGASAALLLLALAIAVAAGSRWRGWGAVAALATAASGGFLVFAIAFAVVAPPEIDQMSLGLGFTCALAGAGFGLAAGQILPAGDDSGEVPPAIAREHTPRSRRALGLLGAGLIAALVGLHSRTWWVDDNPNLVARHGVRDGETCWKGEPACEIETWNSQPAGATGPRPVRWHVAFRASEATFLLGHLAVMVAALVLILLLRGQLVAGAWAPHRILVVLAIGFLASAALLAFGSLPDSMDSRSHRSFGPILALLGGALMVWGGVAAGRLPRAH